VEADVVVGRLPEDLRELRDRQDGRPGPADEDAPQLVADADLGVVGDEGEPVVGGGGLDVAEDRLGGPCGDRGRDQLAGRLQTVPLARYLHGEALLAFRGSWFTPALGSRLTG